MKETQSSLFCRIRNNLGTKKQHSILAFLLAWRNVSRTKYWSTLLLLGIALTIALETGIVVSVDTLYDDFIYNNRNQNYTDLSIIPKTWTDLPALNSITNDISSVAGVKSASPVYKISIDRILKNEFPLSNILIYGIDPKSHPDFTSIKMVEGRRRISSNSIIISQKLLIDSGIKVGDSFNTTDIELSVETTVDLKEKSFIVDGIMEDPSFFGNNVGFFFILMDIDALIDIVPEEERGDIMLSKIDVSVSNFLEIKKTCENIKDKLDFSFNVWMEKDVSDIETTGIRVYQTALNLVIVVSIIVAFLFITNILTIAIQGRSKEFGILRAVGINSNQLISSIMVEILIYSVIGSLIGIIGGILFAILLLGRMQDFYFNLDFRRLSLNFSSLSVSFSSGILVSIISGLYPLFLALSLPIVQNIHSRANSGSTVANFKASWKYIVTMGALLALTGFIMQYFVGPTRFLEFNLLSIQFLIVLLIFMGMIIIEVGVLVFLPRIANRFLTPIFGIITCTISTRNIARNFQKSLFTVMTAALALAFIMIVGLVSSIVINSVPGYYQEQWGTIDIMAEAWDDKLPDINLTQSLEEHEEVLKASFIQEERTVIQGIDSYVYGVDPLKYAYFAEYTIESLQESISSFMYLDFRKDSFSRDITYGLISDLLFQKTLTSVGSNITVKIADKSTVNVTVAAVVKSNVFLGNGEYLYISTTRFNELFSSSQAKWFLCDIEGNLDYIRGMIETSYPEFKDVVAIDLFTRAIERSLVFQSVLFQILFIESFILAALTQFISILVSTHRMERDMGIMRAIGLSKTGVFNIFMSESIALGFTALIIGIINGLLGSYLLSWYINFSIPVEVYFPFDQIVWWVVASFFLTLATTMIPSFRSSRKNVVTTISDRPFAPQYIDRSAFPQAVFPSWDMIKMANSPFADERIKTILTPFPTISVRKFIDDNSAKLRRIFLFLGIGVFITLLCDNIDIFIIRGLISFDFIWRLYYSFLPVSEIYHILNQDIFMMTNLFLLIVGFAVIGPISIYISDNRVKENFFSQLIHSSFAGFLGLCFCLITPLILFTITIVLLAPFSLFLINFSAVGSFQNLEIISHILSIAFIGFQLVLFQKVWAYLVFRGMSSDLSFEQKIKWVRKISLKDQAMFFGLILLHLLGQIILFFLLEIPREVIVQDAELVRDLSPILLIPQDLLVFIILLIFEVGFFLFLIVYQVVNFRNQSFLLSAGAVTEPVNQTIFTVLRGKTTDFHRITEKGKD